MVTVVPLGLLNGLVYPYPTIGLLSTYIFGRYLYTGGYIEKDGAFSKKRIAGSILCNLSNFGIMCTTLFLGIRMSRGKLLGLVKKL